MVINVKEMILNTATVFYGVSNGFIDFVINFFCHQVTLSLIKEIFVQLVETVKEFVLGINRPRIDELFIFYEHIRAHKESIFNHPRGLTPQEIQNSKALRE